MWLCINDLRSTLLLRRGRLVTFLVKAGFYATILAHLASILHGSNGISPGKVGYILSNLAQNVTESLRLLRLWR